MNTPATAPSGRTEIVLIAAMARQRVIGRANALPWHLPEDMAHFRAATQGHAVLMGRKTWDSLPARFRPLPGRRNVVVTRQPGWQAAGAEAAASPQAALARLADADRVFVIGGAEIYAATLPLADTLMLTEIDADIEGDAHFPDFQAAPFELVARAPGRAPGPAGWTFSFATYRRRR